MQSFFHLKNCNVLGNNISGIYEILPTHSKARFFVLCDMETWGGGWTHIQKRFDGSQDFTLPWRDYKFGFGDLEGEFWLGLQNIYLLSGNKDNWRYLDFRRYITKNVELSNRLKKKKSHFIYLFIYFILGFEPTELLVEIVDRDNVSAYAHYKSFAIGPEPGGYKLDRLAGFSGDAGDSLTYNLGQKFSTKDLDFSENCVSKYREC